MLMKQSNEIFSLTDIRNRYRLEWANENDVPTLKEELFNNYTKIRDDAGYIIGWISKYRVKNAAL